jgi:hypothetical protein
MQEITENSKVTTPIRMKLLKHLLVAVSMNVAAAAKARQSVASPTAASVPMLSQASTNAGARVRLRAKLDRGANKKNQCVGTVTFCNIYFGG